MVIGRTRIDYDVDKESINREKHGYSLESAVQLLERILFPLGGPPPCMTCGGFIKHEEVRHKHMGVDDSGKVVVLVTTMRPDEIVRVISFRRASNDERDKFYEVTGFKESAI